MVKRVVIALTAIVLISCGGQKGLSKNDVVVLMDEYFENVKQNDFSLIEPYYSQAFYEKTGKEKWEELYTRIHAVLGELVSTELTSWSMRSVIATSGSGKHFTLVYKNKYENGDTTETINLFVPKNESTITINSHNYNSEAFLGL
jgi:hypothetical protein